MKTIFITAFLLFIQTFVFAQAPQGIPYQAVMRNADGSVMASSAVNLIFVIHDGTATVYQESQEQGSFLKQDSSYDEDIANSIHDVMGVDGQYVGTSNLVKVDIGQDFQGGKVAYIFQPGDAGYVAGETHGLIAAAQDLSGPYQWGCSGTSIEGADGLAIGTGAQNTLEIVAAGCGGAAAACANLELNGYDDWFLPSIDELVQLFINRILIDGFEGHPYWSSSEYNLDSPEDNSDLAWIFVFSNGGSTIYGKADEYPFVRPVRYF